MLVLQRKKNESIIIGDIITVTVLQVRGDRVRIGIDAPQNMTIHRKEIWLQLVCDQHAEEPSVTEEPAVA